MEHPNPCSSWQEHPTSAGAPTFEQNGAEVQGHLHLLDQADNEDGDANRGRADRTGVKKRAPRIRLERKSRGVQDIGLQPCMRSTALPGPKRDADDNCRHKPLTSMGIYAAFPTAIIVTRGNNHLE